MLRKQAKLTAFLNLELAYVKKASKIDGLP